jgi:integrase
VSTREDKVPVGKLSKIDVRNAKPREVRYAIFDETVPGLNLRVYPTGKKVWAFDYRPGEGGRSAPVRRLTIGIAAYPDGSRKPDFTPEAARAAAGRLRAAVLMGRDPQGEIANERRAETLEELARHFLSQHIAAKRGTKTFEFYRDAFERIILPRLGRQKAKSITSREWSGLHQALAETPYLANRVLAVASSMYGWATGAVGLLPEGLNPTARIERYEERSRGRRLSASELERLGRALEIAETSGIPWNVDAGARSKHLNRRRQSTIVDPYAIAAIKLLLLTGARLREILELRWDQVDLDNGLLILERHKSSRTTGTKAVILNSPAIAILETLPRGGRYVISSASAGTADERPRADLKRPWEAIRKEAGLSDLRIHDLRHNFGSVGAGDGYGLPIIGKLLGHSQPRTTARYAHLDVDPVRRASELIARSITSAMDRRHEVPGDESRRTEGSNHLPQGDRSGQSHAGVDNRGVGTGHDRETGATGP